MVGGIRKMESRFWKGILNLVFLLTQNGITMALRLTNAMQAKLLDN